MELVRLEFLCETRCQGIIRVELNIVKSRTCFVEYNYHDSLQVRLKEGIGHLRTWGSPISLFQFLFSIVMLGSIVKPL